MKYTIVVVFVLVFISSLASAQVIGEFEDEPTIEQLGAPLYPGSVFIRKTVVLDPFHETVMYISLVPMKMVETFFNRQLPEKRVVYYSDENIYLTIYLLKTWSKFPGKPTREELSKLESEPNVQIRFYDPYPYEPLAEYFDKKPDGKIKANAIRNGKTMIRYTYEKSEEYKSSKQIIAAWTEISRDLEDYYGSVLQFNLDSTYTFTFTAENICAMSKKLAMSKNFKGWRKDAIKKYIEERNPEKGTYVIMKNTITMVSDKPVDGMRTKSGLAHVGTATLSLELIYKPRLTFLRTSLE